MRLFRDHNMLTQICGNNFMVLKVAPPLVTTEGQLEEFVAAIREVSIWPQLDRLLGGSMDWRAAR